MQRWMDGLAFQVECCKLINSTGKEQSTRAFNQVRLKELCSLQKKLNGPSPGSLSFIFVFSNKHYNFSQQMYVEKCYVHRVYDAGIRTHNLQTRVSSHNH